MTDNRLSCQTEDLYASVTDSVNPRLHVHAHCSNFPSQCLKSELIIYYTNVFNITLCYMVTVTHCPVHCMRLAALVGTPLLLRHKTIANFY